jgi:hypothetical protein
MHQKHPPARVVFSIFSALSIMKKPPQRPIKNVVNRLFFMLILINFKFDYKTESKVSSSL